MPDAAQDPEVNQPLRDEVRDLVASSLENEQPGRCTYDLEAIAYSIVGEFEAIHDVEFPKDWVDQLVADLVLGQKTAERMGSWG